MALMRHLAELYIVRHRLIVEGASYEIEIEKLRDGEIVEPPISPSLNLSISIFVV
jgi:hypothetical protein